MADPIAPFTGGVDRGPEEVVKVVRQVTLAGLAINLALSAVKFAAGILGNSQAVVADAVHSLSDTATDVAVLVGVKFWSKPPDGCHPHGHQRIEFLVTIFIGLLLAAVALGLVYNALVTLQVPHRSPPGLIAFFAALLSIFSKELLYRWTISVGREIKSTALIANAWHHRSDGLSSVPTAAAVAGAALVPGLAFLDHLGAIVVSMFILQAAWKIVRPSVEQLVDRGAPEEICRGIEQLAATTPGVRAVHAIRTRHIGSGIEVDLHVLVDPEISVEEGHRISEEVERRLVEYVSDVVDVVVHLEPYNAEERRWR
ncbi:cation diffusion facilitator family transporter [Methanotrichaceae archaeon M04Ac]|uniref:Cation diffusion facilitator family transporter n=1 Tax=Candidatus Methanocrinis alkalitolerans TaxID=3033395 RepID=A0ABT5XH85_9EURY|nr:cation diffusion facilitator family transporter [Candidatus Methanocrinis alkalitolerans]MCR3884273.1 cation diffusion facilitator family transporter [Methanothrix sp.]MDF0594078.1 cation diffusion facilitator family transporter [Candidatus Methanocrinis alkalitolerans]